MKFFIQTFGCQQNKADSERIAAAFRARGMTKADRYENANYVIVNTCMVRRSAEDRVYGLVINLGNLKEQKRKEKKPFKIIVTGCMVGLAFRDKTGAYLQKIRERMPQVDEFMPIEEVGFDTEPVRQDKENAWVPISNGCNNFCTFCVVPFTRGREISRPYEDIIHECQRLKSQGYRAVTLLGQNVNSYGADLVLGEKNIQVMRDIDKTYFRHSTSTGVEMEGLTKPIEGARDTLFRATWELSRLTGRGFPRSREKEVSRASPSHPFKVTYVKHLGRYRIPTLFPRLLEEVARMGFERVEFYSSNPWDFSDELIAVIARNENITRTLHLPVQSGDNNVLQKMNRWYTREEYLRLIKNLKFKIKNLKVTTDIIVGFCGETDEQFQQTVDLAKEVDFFKAYVAMYSPRPMTAATKSFEDDVPMEKKQERWNVLENLINKPHLSEFKKKAFPYRRQQIVSSP